MGDALLTDLYELNMAASYLRRGMTSPATFSLFVRALPPTRGFLVAAGLEPCLEHLERLSFTEEDLAHVGSVLGYDRATLEAFRGLRFTGEVHAVPEGTVVFANEPILEVTAPVAEAQIVETYMLNQVTSQTTLATKAARCRIASAGKIDLVDFSFRRTHGLDAAMAMSRVSAMVGFVATSNVEAGRRFGLRAAGTMAHSYVQAFADEEDAFRAFAADFPGRTTFLVDTYDTRRGIGAAIRVICDLGLTENVSVRLDSGDLAALSREARRLLDEAGLPFVRIFASGGLDEHDVAGFVADGVPVDALGIGTKMGVSADAPYLDSVYKLVEFRGRPVLKLSTGKETWPGAKQVYRLAGKSDVLALRMEEPPKGAIPLLEQVMAGGRRTRPAPGLAEARSRFERDLVDLPGGALDLRSPVAPVARASPALMALETGMREGSLA